MKRLLVLVLLALSAPGLAGAQARTAQATTPPGRNIRYGANPAAAHTFAHDGVRLYYEVYAAGEPRTAGARQRRQHRHLNHWATEVLEEASHG